MVSDVYSDELEDPYADELLGMLVETGSEEKLLLSVAIDEPYAEERLGMLLEADCE